MSSIVSCVRRIGVYFVVAVFGLSLCTNFLFAQLAYAENVRFDISSMDCEQKEFICPIEQISTLPEDEEYVGIYSANDIANLAIMDAEREGAPTTYVLMNDIDMSSWGAWTPPERIVHDFNGNGHVISNLMLSVPTSHAEITRDYDRGLCKRGLFSEISSVYDLGLENVTVSKTIDVNDLVPRPNANNYEDSFHLALGGIAGEANFISNCWATVDFEINIVGSAFCTYQNGITMEIGGIAGWGNVRYSHTAGSVKINSNMSAAYEDPDAINTGYLATSLYVGGLCAVGNADDSYNTAIIDACNQENGVACKGSTVIVAGVTADGDVSRCWNGGAVSGQNSFSNPEKELYWRSSPSLLCVGGIVGSGTHESGMLEVFDSYNTGTISASSKTDLNLEVWDYGNLSESYASSAGGIIGRDESAEVTNVYNMGPVFSDADFKLTGSWQDIESEAGAIIGCSSDYVEVHDAYFWNESPAVASIICDYGVASSTSQLSNQSTFSNWDFNPYWGVWKMGEGDYPYPVLQALGTTSEVPDIPDPGPDEPAECKSADSELVQLAVSALSGFKLDDVHDNVPVSTFVESSGFQSQDKRIWSDSDTKYSYFFNDALHGYTIVGHSSTGLSKYIAVKNDESGEIVIAYDPNSLQNAIQVGNSLWNSSVSETFDAAASSFNDVRKNYPNSKIYPTGYFLGGMSAAYVATVAGEQTNVFDGLPGLAIRLAYLTQPGAMNVDAFHGKNQALVTNWYNGATGYAEVFDFKDGLSYGNGVKPNPAGKSLELSSLFYETYSGSFYVGSTFIDSSNVSEVAMVENVGAVKACLDSITNTVVSFLAGQPKIDFSFLTKGTRLTLGTTNNDSVTCGRDDAFWQVAKSQVMYSGDGADYFIGSDKSDVFVLGEGLTNITGGAGSDMYIVSGKARGKISDSMCGNGIAIASGQLDIMKSFIQFNLGEAYSDSALEGVTKIMKELITSSQDTIVFRDCPLSEIKIAEHNPGWGFSSCYTITAGNASIDVSKKSFVSKDFKIVGADGASADLRQLASGKTSARQVAQIRSSNDPSRSVIASEVYASSGELVLASSDGEAIEILSLDDDFIYSIESGNFYYDKGNEILSFAYDRNQLQVSFEDSNIERLFLNVVENDITEFQYADNLSYTTASIGVKDDGQVFLYAVDGGGDSEIQMNPVEVEADKITLNKSTMTLPVGSSDRLIATVSPDSAINKSVTWSSSDPSVANVDENGSVTAVKKGSTAIYATTSNGLVARCDITVDEAQPSIPMYRLYNRITSEHFYTASAYERDVLARGDWNYEGVGWYAPTTGSPVYRLYNPGLGDHHYTTNKGERDMLIRTAGWQDEGIGWYSGGSTPLYRQYNPGLKVGQHNYTVSAYERNVLVANHGWQDEGIGWYGL